METNILKGLFSLINNPNIDLNTGYVARNRANNMGDALEYYVKDLFCDTFNEEDQTVINQKYNEYFSYLGNQNNPPDIILRNGDAIEVKKIEGFGAGIALNSSYPKNKLYSDSPMITQACRDCEDWREKDIIYVIGVPQDDKLKSLWFVYGDCYAADRNIYERIKNKISDGVNELPDIEFAETNELGRVNKVDPLGITYLRIRGMWHIENPSKVFDYITTVDISKELNVNAIILTEKYNSFPEEDIQRLENLNKNGFSIRDVQIKSPNNSADLLDAKLINYIV